MMRNTTKGIVEDTWDLAYRKCGRGIWRRVCGEGWMGDCAKPEGGLCRKQSMYPASWWWRRGATWRRESG